MSRASRAIFHFLGVVELIVDGVDLIKGFFKKSPSRKVREMLDEQDEEVIPLRRAIRPPPLKAKPGGGAPPRGPAR